MPGSRVEPGRALAVVDLLVERSSEPWRKPSCGLSLWIGTDRLDDLYSTLKRRRLGRSRATLAGQEMDAPEVQFTQDLHTAFYGQREFGIRDPNGIVLMFTQPVD